MSVWGYGRNIDIEQERAESVMILNEVEKGKRVIREAAEILGISERQGRRILAAYRKEGAAGFQPKRRRTRSEFKDRVLGK
jgi:transposase